LTARRLRATAKTSWTAANTPPPDIVPDRPTSVGRKNKELVTN
jgi:hypothetical protein